MISHKRVCVVGLGYIGLPTALLFADAGHQVIGVDINPTIVAQVRQATIHSPEPGLSDLTRSVVSSGRLSAQMSPEPADVFIVAVPTPLTVDRRADLSAIMAALEAIVPHLRPGNMVILESTVPPGTTATLVVSILEQSGLRVGDDLYVAHAPERVLPGRILGEMVQNDRTIGGIDRESAERARELYRTFVKGEIYLTDATTAELVKVMENTYRDVNIALANSFAQVAEKLGVDVWRAIELANRHPRVKVLRPGPGVGGHCIAVSPWFVVEKAPLESQLITAARKVNDAMPSFVAAAILELLKPVADPQVAVLGAAYKPNVNDTRESPALHVVDLLTEQGCLVRVHDPYVYPGISLMDAVDRADCLVLLVGHREYADLNPGALGEVMRHRMAFDAQDSLPGELWEAAGFRLRKLGRVCCRSEVPIADQEAQSAPRLRQHS